MITKRLQHRALTLTAILAALTLTASVSACSGKKTDSSQASAATGVTAPKNQTIAVFVPGVVSGSPVYEMLVAGVERAVAENGSATLQVIEAGTNQAEWGDKLTSLVSDGSWGLVITSNPAMPEIAAPIAEKFPSCQFMIFDAWYKGNPRVTTFRYNQREQAYISGYMAALATTGGMKHSLGVKKVGLIAGQEYPAMNGIILPGYLEGAQAVDPAFEVDFRVVGNWYDATKGAELASAMRKAGVSVVMPISGGANQGVLSAAAADGFYVAWFDDNGYAKAPGFVVSSSVMAQERLAYEKTKAWLEGTLVTGAPSTVGIADGYVDFVSGDPAWVSAVPEGLRTRMLALMDRLRSGELKLPVE